MACLASSTSPIPRSRRRRRSRLRGKAISVSHKHRYCEKADLDHSWDGTHHEYDHGRMDGFARANVNAKDPTGKRSLGFYTRKDLPFYYWLYRKFAIGDRYFAS